MPAMKAAYHRQVKTDLHTRNQLYSLNMKKILLFNSKSDYIGIDDYF